MHIGIIDYQASNLGSLSSALRELQISFFVSSNPTDFNNVDLILLPGVGSFKSGMMNLEAYGLDKTIIKHASLGKPILGICLGMHLLSSVGYEGGIHQGLNLIPGKVLKLQQNNNFRVPHMGWDVIQGNEKKEYVYFAHSFFFSPEEQTQTTILSHFQSGDSLLPAQIKLGNISGIQFHPEKSGPAGLQIMKETLEDLMSNH
jgi:glutamine amidotransferase